MIRHAKNGVYPPVVALKSLALPLVFALALAACSSTVENVGVSPADVANTTNRQNATNGLQKTQETKGSNPANSSTAPGVSTKPGSAPGITSTAPPGFPLKGRGWDERNVYFGFVTAQEAGETTAAFGFGEGIDFGDNYGQARAIVADINKRGGLLGRRLVPVFTDWSLSKTLQDHPAQMQAQCVFLTEDRPVIAAVHFINNYEPFAQCMAKHRTPISSNNAHTYDDAYQKQWVPYIYRSTMASYTRVTPLWLKRLVGLRYFTGWDTSTGGPGPAPVKVGLFMHDTVEAQRVFADIRSQLKSLGFPPAAEFQYNRNNPDSVNSAVLRFRSAQVTHIVSGEFMPMSPFMTNAESQGYRPRYALNTIHEPTQGLVLLAPPAQLVGSLGIGWNPANDVDALHDPKGGVGPGESRCRRLMKDAGVDYQRSRNATWASFIYCDAAFMFTQAAVAAGSFDPVSMKAALARIGSSFESAGTFGSALSSGTGSELAKFARDLGFNTGCRCFVYLSDRNYPL